MAELKPTINALNKKIKQNIKKRNEEKWLNICSKWKSSSKLWKKITNLDKTDN